MPAVARKADFDAEEWQTIAAGPVLAGLRVVAADRGGTLRETLAVGQAYAAAREHHGESELLDAIVDSPPSVSRSELENAELPALTGERLRGAMALLRERGSKDDQDAYAWFVRSVAEAVARAHKEGGFLGIGGHEISEAERAALDEIDAALR